MAEVTSAIAVTCPSCAVQAVIRVWTCGCQGIEYPNHPVTCEQPRPYFDAYLRYCLKIDTHGSNPQTH
jgi:hypothetical protein